MPLLIVLVVLSGALLAPGLLVGPSLDAAVFSHVGGQLVDGVAPYVGAWDHKPPGMYLVAGAGHAVLGWLGPWTADWLISLATTVGLGAAIAAVLGRVGVTGWPRTLAVVGATIVACQYLLALGGGLTEPPATLLIAWAMVLALGRASWLRGLGIGALVAVSLLLSIQLLLGALVVVVLSLFLQPPGTRAHRAVAMAIGFAAPVVLAAGWLATIGALTAAAETIVTYSAAYRSSSGEYGSTLGAAVAAWTVLSVLYLVVPGLLGAMSIGAAPQPRRGVMLAALVWLAVSVPVFVIQGRFYAHYVIPLAVPLGVLAGVGLERVAETLRRTPGLRTRTVIFLPLVGTIAISLFAGVLSAAMQIAPVADRSARMQVVAQRLEHLPGTTLLVWGNEPRLYDLSGRAPTTRYSYLYPLTTPGYSTQAMVDAVLLRLTGDPAAVVVDAGSNAPGQPGFLPLLIDRPIATDGRDLDLLDPLRKFVAEHYLLTDTVAGWPIYVLSDEAR